MRGNRPNSLKYRGFWVWPSLTSGGLSQGIPLPWVRLCLIMLASSISSWPSSGQFAISELGTCSITRGPLSGPQHSTYVRPARSSWLARGPDWTEQWTRQSWLLPLSSSCVDWGWSNWMQLTDGFFRVFKKLLLLLLPVCWIQMTLIEGWHLLARNSVGTGWISSIRFNIQQCWVQSNRLDWNDNNC